jgi:hypothetical protein
MLSVDENQDAGEAGEELLVLDEIARAGAQRMLMTALKWEADSCVGKSLLVPVIG